MTNSFCVFNPAYLVIPVRCKKWVQNSGLKCLLQLNSSLLHKKFYVCNHHFDDDQFYNLDRKTLLPTAVPSTFVSNKLTDEEMQIFPVLGIEQLAHGK